MNYDKNALQYVREKRFLIDQFDDWLLSEFSLYLGNKVILFIVTRWYTKKDLAEKVTNAGFSIVKQKYVNILGAIGWWFNGRILRKTVPPSGQLKMLNPMIPVLRKIEGVFPVPFGISTLMIARKL